MAIADWSTNADSNTSIDGISIAEHCSPANINDAIRAVMAACKSEQLSKNAALTAIEAIISGLDSDVSMLESAVSGLDTEMDGKLSLTGGTLTGNLVFNQNDSVLFKGQNSGRFILRGGTSYFEGGASLYLYGAEYDGQNVGSFSLYSHNGTTSYQLRGMSDGSLAWDGHSIETVDSSGSQWIRYTNGLQLCWGIASITNEVKVVTLPKAYKNTSYAISVLGPRRYAVAGSVPSASTINVGCSDPNTQSVHWATFGFWK